MATVRELHACGSARWSHLLLIEGLPYGFTDSTEIAGTAWIGDGRELLSGLSVPTSIVVETDPRTGLLRENKATFGLLDDCRDLVANLFRAQFAEGELEQVTQRLAPSDDPAPTPLLGPGGAVDLHDRHIGIEKIGPAGERRHWYITPSDVPPGLDHAWITGEGAASLPPIYVSDDPYAFAGRRVGLYRIVYDPDADLYPSLSDQYDGGSLIWVGTLTGRGRIVDVSKFEIDCAGPASWTRKLLNQNREPTFRQLSPRVDILPAESGVAVWYERPPTTAYEATIFDPTNDLSSALQTPLDVANAISEIVNDSKNGIGNNSIIGDYWREPPFNVGNDADFDLGTATITTFDTVGNAYGQMNMVLHRKVWAVMGWDVEVQPGVSRSDPIFVAFSQFPIDSTIFQHGSAATFRAAGDPVLDAEGYYLGIFHTYHPDPAKDIESDNDGDPRTFRARFDGGAVALTPTAQNVSMGLELVYIEGQLAVTPSQTEGVNLPEIDGTPVDTMGWWVFRGRIARDSDAFSNLAPEEYAQVARCSWVDSGSNTIAPDANGITTLHVEKWEDPRAFGLPFERMSASWLAAGSTSIEAAPIGVLGGYYFGAATEPDEAHRVITRILLSSGTAGPWASLILPPGDNHPTVSDPSQFWGGDLEIADLGCAIPETAIDYQSFRDEADRLPNGDAGPLNRCKYAALGAVQAEEILSSALSSRGWAFSWRRTETSTHPQWGAFTVFAPVDPGEIEFFLTESDKAGDPKNNRTWISGQELVYAAPVDSFRVSARQDLLGGDQRFEDAARSRDREARGRSGRIDYEITDAGLSDPSLWPATQGKWQWVQEWRDYWSAIAGPWYAKRNALITAQISAPKGQYLYPGTTVAITDPRILNPDGTYGIEAQIGRVIRTELILSGKFAGSTRAGIILHQDQIGAAGGGRVWGPSARVASYDPGPKELTIAGAWSGDWLGFGSSGHSDAEAFAEPSWSSFGGVTKGYLIQSEDGGEQWGDRVDFDIIAVDTAAHTMIIANETGTIYRDMDKLVFLADYDGQPAGNWVRGVFSVTTNETEDPGTFGVGPTNGFRLT